MDVRQKQRTVIEFLLLEGRPVDEIAKVTRSFPCRHEKDAAIRSIRQDDPNASLRTIGENLSISPETVRAQMAKI
jgi:hypothetical protein